MYIRQRRVLTGLTDYIAGTIRTYIRRPYRAAVARGHVADCRPCSREGCRAVVTAEPHDRARETAQFVRCAPPLFSVASVCLHCL